MRGARDAIGGAMRWVRRRLRVGRMQPYLAVAARTPGWRSSVEAEELAAVCRSLPDDAVVVEIGAFMGSGTVILAGARRLAGGGRVHAIDPFDGSGDVHSAPIYRQIIDEFGMTVRERFDRTICEAGVADWLTVHPGTAESVIEEWSTPIDLLLIDGDQSRAGARSAFDLWEPWLRTGGVIALSNSAPRDYDEHHDGQFLVADRLVVAPWFGDRRVVGNWTFVRKRAVRPSGE